MIRGICIAGSGMLAESARQDVVASNLANATTTGGHHPVAGGTGVPRPLARAPAGCASIGAEAPVLNISPVQILIVLLVVLLLFGARRLPEMARGLGQGLRELRGSLSGEDRERPERPEAGDPRPEEPDDAGVGPGRTGQPGGGSSHSGPPGGASPPR